MRYEQLDAYDHDHTFGANQPVTGEIRTRWVVALTLIVMVVEVLAGHAFGSMALLADGWHMGTHAAALGVSLFAYAFARKHANNPRYSFGTGKVGALGGFASAVGLALVALAVLYESGARLQAPVPIHFDEAMAVAALGLVVNLASAWLLGGGGGHGHAHGHGHGQTVKHRDHNLRGAYLHVLADALTSVLALVALWVGKRFGWTWMDPAMGLVGSCVIAVWSYDLLRDTSRVLLDAEVPPALVERIRQTLEECGGERVTDLHVWRVGPSHLAAVVSVVCEEPRQPEHFKEKLEEYSDLAHVTVEVRQRTSRGASC